MQHQIRQVLDDVPGIGKTSLAVALGLTYNRVQFTPDVLPSDLVGDCPDCRLHPAPRRGA